jgi:hypothetical protein
MRQASRCLYNIGTAHKRSFRTKVVSRGIEFLEKGLAEKSKLIGGYNETPIISGDDQFSDDVDGNPVADRPALPPVLRGSGAQYKAAKRSFPDGTRE